MQIPTEAEVRETLKPLEPVALGILLDVWRRYVRMLHSEMRVDVARTRANVLWDWFTQEARVRFAAIDGVEVLLRPNTVWYLIAGRYVVRFKKMSASGFTSNVATQAALDFHDQQQPLVGIDPVWKLDLGYVLDAQETQVADVLMVLRNGDRIEWEYSLFDQGGENLVSLTGKPDKPMPRTVFTVKGVLEGDADQADGERER